MSDSRRQYCAIRKALNQHHTQEPKGRLDQHLNILAMMVSGILASGKVSLSKIAEKVPTEAKPDSRIRKMERWLGNKKIDLKTCYLPYLRVLLQCLAGDTLVLVMDGSLAGRGCVLLSLNLVYKKRAIPICWTIVKGKKGHLPVETHLQLIRDALDFLPKENPIVFLGDGEFDGVELISAINDLGWEYACRTAVNVLLKEMGEKFSPQDLLLRPGDEIELPGVQFTEKGYGPVLICIIWEKGWKDPLILVSNFEILEEAYYWYRLRFKIETFFSDQKSRGFNIHKSHISDTDRLNRLMIAACIAYLWMVCLGALVVQRGLLPLIHRKSRCDWSLFHIGMDWLSYCLNEDRQLVVLFRLPRAAPGDDI